MKNKNNLSNSEILDLLDACTVSKRNGVYTVKRSYFWGVSNDGSGFAEKVRKTITGSRIVDYGNHFHHFVGGAKSGSRKDSYYWVKFTISDK